MGEWVDVAVTANAKNNKEGLVVRCTAGSSFLLREGMEVAFVPPVLDAPRRARVSRVAAVNGMKATVAFAGVTEADAQALAGCHLLARRADFADGELEGVCGLAGFEVHDERAGLVGVVADLIDNPAQALLEVTRPDGSTVLVPVVDEIVRGVDEDARRIDICAPAGLLEL